MHGRQDSYEAGDTGAQVVVLDFAASPLWGHWSHSSVSHRLLSLFRIVQGNTLVWRSISLPLASSYIPCCCCLSCFSRVRLCATPQTAAYQAPPSLGFSRQEHWSGWSFPPQIHELKSQSEVAQSCPTLCNPMDCSLPGSSIHGIFQARVLE